MDSNLRNGKSHIKKPKKDVINGTPDVIIQTRVNRFNEIKSIILAILTAILYATQNFLLGDLSHYGYMARAINSIGWMSLSFGFYLGKWYKHKSRNEPYFTKEKSIFFYKNTKKINFWVVSAVLFISMNSTVAGTIIIYSFKFALRSGINIGIISTIFGVTPFITYILFYLFYKEILKPSQLIGMIFMIAWITLIAFGVRRHTPVQVDISNSNYGQSASDAFYAVFLAWLCPIIFGAGSLIIREVNRRFDTDPKELTHARFMFSGLILIIVVVLEYTYGSYTFNLREFLQIVLTGIFAGIGSLLSSEAITIGYAGVVTSLVNLQAIFLTILQAIFLFRIPNTIEIIAVLIGITGSCIMSLDFDILGNIKKLYKKVHDE